MKEYIKEDVRVIWQADKCIHAAECVKNLPGVFKPKEKPWIRPENGSKQEIINTVHKCPSGALSINQD